MSAQATHVQPLRDRLVQGLVFGLSCPVAVWLAIWVCGQVGLIDRQAANWGRAGASLYIVAAFALITGLTVPPGIRGWRQPMVLSSVVVGLYVLVQLAQFVPFAERPDANILLYFLNLAKWSVPMILGSALAGCATTAINSSLAR